MARNVSYTTLVSNVSERRFTKPTHVGCFAIEVGTCLGNHTGCRVRTKVKIIGRNSETNTTRVLGQHTARCLFLIVPYLIGEKRAQSKICKGTHRANLDSCE